MLADASTDPNNSQLLLQQGLRELEQYLAEGKRFASVQVFANHPELEAETETFLEVLYTEHVMLEERGEFRGLSDWQAKFPTRCSEIHSLFNMHGYLAGMSSKMDRTTVADSRKASSGSEASVTARMGNYRLLEQIGRGGMGVVYRARQLGLDRIVCLKISHHSVGNLAMQQEQISKEAEIAARLQHPNIVQIFEIGVENCVPFFSMEYVDGPSLASIIQQNPLAPMTAARMIERLARAVEYAHSQGIIHRDIKPANVILAISTRAEALRLNGHTLDAEGGSTTIYVEPKIADFGLAKQVGGDQANTLPGSVLGTPSYMAPEQTGLAGSVTGPACDIYSLGAVLYDCLVGRPPFRAATPIETIMQVQNEEPISLRSIQPSVPRDLETICLKCLNKLPDRRYQSAGQLADDVGRFLSGVPIRARQATAAERMVKWTMRHPALAGMLVTLAICIAAISWQWLRAEGHRSRAEANEASANIARADEQMERRRLERILYANNVLLAQREYESNNVSRALQLLNSCPEHLRHWEWDYLQGFCRTGVMELDPFPLSVGCVAFSSDNQRLAATSSEFGSRALGDVRIYDLKSMQSKTLANIPYPVSCVTFSSDGSRLITLGRAWQSPGKKGGLKIWNAETGSLISTWGDVDGLAVEFSPDGKFFAVAEEHGLSLRSAENGALIKQLLRNSATVYDVSWSPDGRSFVSAGRDGNARIWDAASARQINVIEFVNSVVRADWSPNGDRIAVGAFNGLVKVFEIENVTGEFRELFRVSEKERLTGLRFSPDGQYLGLSYFDSGSRIIDAQSGLPIRSLPGHNGAPLEVEFGNGGASVATAGADGKVRVWDLASPTQPTLNGSGGPYLADVQHVPGSDDVLLALCENISLNTKFENRILRLWNSVEKKVVKEFTGFNDWLTSAAVHPKGQIIAGSSLDGTVRLWNRHDQSPLHILKCDEAVTGVCFFENGNRLAAVDAGGTLHIWATDEGKELRQLSIGNGRPNHLAAGNASAWLVIATTSGVKVVNGVDESAPVVIVPCTDQVLSTAMNLDGSLIALATDTSEVQIWRMNELSQPGARPMVILKGHTEPVSSLCFTDDSRRLCTTSPDRTVKLWDVDSGQAVLNLRGNIIGSAIVDFNSEAGRITLANRTYLQQWHVNTWSADAVQSAKPLSDDLDLYRWHERELARATRVENWHAAAMHATTMIERLADDDSTNPTVRSNLFRKRALARSRQSQWELALQDLQAISSFQPDDLYLQALIRLKTGDVAGFRECASKMYFECASTDSPDSANMLLWLCAFGETDAIDQSERLMRLLSAKPAVNYYSTMSAVQYRHGQFLEAKKSIDMAIAKRKPLPAEEKVLLAMVLTSLGETQEADLIVKDIREWLLKQRDLVKQHKVTDKTYSWTSDFESDLLLVEFARMKTVQEQQ